MKKKRGAAEMGVPAVRDEDRSGGPGVVRAVPCRGHAFDEALLCPCGTTWFEHQSAPRRCRVGAQRCKRADAAPPAHGTGDGE
jgi:hypothetical protein